MRLFLATAAGFSLVAAPALAAPDVCTYLKAGLAAQPGAFASLYAQADTNGDRVPSVGEVGGAQICRIMLRPGQTAGDLCIWDVKSLDPQGRKARLDGLRGDIHACLPDYVETARGGGSAGSYYVAPGRPTFMLVPTDGGEIYLIIPGPKP